jgi:Ca2+-binding EF-hand superfamily protein
MKTRSLFSLLLTLGLCAGAAQAKGEKKEHKNRDTDGNGTLSLEEFSAGSKDAAKAKAKFEAADANKDGQLDKTELAAIKKPEKKAEGAEKKEGGEEKKKD